MATQIAGRQRIETPARWAKALDRAIANGIEVFVVNDTGERMATSATAADTLYRVTATECTCAAGVAGDPVCQHRAALRFILGYSAEPAPVEMVQCAGCRGKGWNYYEIDGGRSFPGKEPCRRCGGSGVMPVRIRTLEPEPRALAAD